MKIAVAGATGTVGRHVVAVARERGHEVLALSRAAGVDLTSGLGLAETLSGSQTVIDVTSISTQSAEESKRFFTLVTSHLLAAEVQAGVAHHIALSIVGSDQAPFGYYAGKAAQERLVNEAAVPWTILRATQFHEFARQIYGQVTIGPFTIIPTMISQPVAAREVAERLIFHAESKPNGLATDLAGPEVLRMAEMVRRYSKAVGGTARVLELPLPGGFGRALRNSTLVASPSADHGRQTFTEWIESVERLSWR
ncbi:SDR family oxidoreductase [Subtercola frigoramans]|uniref:Uncharacterized protein YbjT (DUF2867 family) n=1 Tax=Subtercola frigoramans TaxID=120298 RepID=A0ABS2L859_9MICO|nr:SDR family oxidoreductase [Subtercola frigoramans]MBM7473076.1 uncharacterized protein YbjT (DUF2867 family) [Subtercola frigoramans]